MYKTLKEVKVITSSDQFSDNNFENKVNEFLKSVDVYDVIITDTTRGPVATVYYLEKEKQ